MTAHDKRQSSNPTATVSALKKRKLSDEFAKGTVKSKLIIVNVLFLSLLLALIILFVAVQDEMSKAGIDPFNWKMILSLGILISLILLFLYLSKTITRSLLFPLRRMVERMVEITDSLAQGRGNFKARIDVFRQDEIGVLRGHYNRLLELLQGMLRKVKLGSHTVLDLTETIRAGSEELSGYTTEQTSSISETTATLETFTQVVKENSRNANEMGSTLENFNQKIQQNRSIIDKVSSTMQEIDDSSKKIDSIITVINDISFQTNLLALNAAVEAARAGEAGRGFAVVAAEVRNLAQKTAESSRTIQDIVSRNVESSHRGMELAQANSAFFGTILEVMQQIVEKIGRITEGSRLQSEGIGDINSTISRLEEIITRNANLVNEFTRTAQDMQTSSSELMAMVDNFDVD